MPSETWQLRRLERQLRVASVRRREAIAVLAEQIGQEKRSVDLVARSRALAAGNAGLRGAAIGSDVIQSSVFSGALATIACDAQKAVDAARERRESAAEELAARERRFDRIEDLAGVQKRKADNTRRLRETTQTTDLARGLHSEAQRRLHARPPKSSPQNASRRVR